MMVSCPAGKQHPVQVAHHAVVVDDGQLSGGEADSHEVVVLLVAAVVRIILGLLRTNEGRGCASMVSVGDVEGGHLGELPCDGLYVLFIVYHPEGVAEAVAGRDEVVHWLARRVAGDDLVQHLIVRVAPHCPGRRRTQALYWRCRRGRASYGLPPCRDGSARVS